MGETNEGWVLDGRGQIQIQPHTNSNTKNKYMQPNHNRIKHYDAIKCGGKKKSATSLKTPTKGPGLHLLPRQNPPMGRGKG